MNSKYAKYSTEQLEVIFTHLADPDEKELVKNELSSRYYQHYINVGNTPGDLLHPDDEAGSPESVSSEKSPGAREGQSEVYPTEDDELTGIDEVAPITLTVPAASEPTQDSSPQSSEKAAGKKYCFIATAAYGSPLAAEVVLLQTYRDCYLAGNRLGEEFIRGYYRLSPRLAGLIQTHRILKLCTRCLLTPLIFLIKQIIANRANH